MAQCEIFEPLKMGIHDRSSLSRVTINYNLKLPLNFFSYQKALHFFKKGGPITQPGGLHNLGYNCYINTVIQCLAFTPGFSQFCLQMPNALYQANSDSAFFLDSFAHIFSDLNNHKSICPTWLLNDSGLIAETFRKPIQQDAHEYLLDLLIAFEKECMAALDNPQNQNVDTMISHFFKSEYRTDITCSKCGATVSRSIKYHDITIPIREYEGLSEAVNALFSSQSTIEGNCEECGFEGTMTKSCKFTKFPLILILTLMRFDNNLRKLEDFFKFPMHIEVDDGKLDYELYAMIVHEGRHISHGHYIAFVKDQNNNWYKADDVLIYRVKDEIVMETCPYVLFYKRSNI